MDGYTPSNSIERRSKPRVNCSYPAIVRGHFNDGIKYETRAVLSNLSASGMYLSTNQPINFGENLFVVVRLSSHQLSKSRAPHLAVSGKVVRVEPKVDGTRGVALKLRQHRFL